MKCTRDGRTSAHNN